MSQRLSVNNFEWREEASQFNENLIRNYDEESDEGYFLEFDTQYLQKLQELQMDLPFLPERKILEEIKKLVTNLHDKNE